MDRLKNRFDIALERIPRNIYEKFPSMMHREINEFFFLILRDIKNRRERFNRNFIGLPGCQNRKKMQAMFETYENTVAKKFLK